MNRQDLDTGDIHALHAMSIKKEIQSPNQPGVPFGKHLHHAHRPVHPRLLQPSHPEVGPPILIQPKLTVRKDDSLRKFIPSKVSNTFGNPLVHLNNSHELVNLPALRKP